MKTLLLLLLALPASAGTGTQGNSCTMKTTFDVNGNCTVYNDTGYTIQQTTVAALSAMAKVKTSTNTIFYSTAYVISPLTFTLAAHTSYYFEYDLVHVSSAIATGVWFGLNYPTASTIAWTVIQATSTTGAMISMSRGLQFTALPGQAVDAVNSPLPARLYGTVSTAGSGDLVPVMKSELANGRGEIQIGSSGRLEEQ